MSRGQWCQERVSWEQPCLWLACSILQSNGIASNNETTWELLKAKHSRGPVPLVQADDCAPIALGPDFNIHSVLLSFPKEYSCESLRFVGATPD